MPSAGRFAAAKVVPLGKECPRCKVFKVKSEFYKSASSFYCKACERERRREYYKREQVANFGPEKASRLQKFKRLQKAEKKDHKVCSKCLVELPLTLFSPQPLGKKGRHSTCKPCHNTGQNVARTRSPRDRFRSTINTAQTSAKIRGLAYNISVEDLILLWEKQGGLCAYSGKAMTFSGDGSETSVSLDRVNPSLGYITSNIVLCCIQANRMKHTLSETELVRWCKAILRTNRSKEPK